MINETKEASALIDDSIENDEADEWEQVSNKKSNYDKIS